MLEDGRPQERLQGGGVDDVGEILVPLDDCLELAGTQPGDGTQLNGRIQPNLFIWIDLVVKIA